MADIREGRSEETIPELESMLQNLFDKEQVQTIINLRKEHEYKMHRMTKRKEDCINFIKFEIKLLKAIRLQHKKKGLVRNAKMTNLEFLFGNRLNKMFIQTIRLFSSDLAIWMMYIKFCKQMKFLAAGSRVWQQLLEQHGGTRPELFKQAATWELEECGCVDKARKYLLMGIHVHKDSRLLLTEIFKLELYDADKKRRECSDNNTPIDPTCDFLTERKAEIIYDCSLKKLNDIELLNDLINICAQYDFASKLLARISQDLCANENDERMWDIIATRELKTEGTYVKLSFKSKIGKCVALYEAAVKKLNTPRMWEYYIDALLEMEKDSSVLPVYKRKLLLNALQKGATEGKLSEKHYLAWVSKLQGSEKHKKLVAVLQGAVERLPQSVTLWHMLLRLHLMKGDEVQAKWVFDKGVSTLTTESLPLWKLMLQFEQTKRNNKMEEIFQKSWNQCPKISGPLKPMYLEWLVLSQGITFARRAYDAMCELPTPCLEMHKKMIYLESIQPTMNMKRIRQSYRAACDQFGSRDVDVWMEYCKFEISNGDPERVSGIYWKAQKTLSPEQIETFNSEFGLIQTIPNPMV